MKKLTISSGGSAISALYGGYFCERTFVLKALRVPLEKDRGIRIVGDATSDVDVNACRTECLALAHAPIAHHGKPKIVLLTQTKDPSRLLAFLDAGVCGYVRQSSKPEYLLDAIFRAAVGR